MVVAYPLNVPQCHIMYYLIVLKPAGCWRHAGCDVVSFMGEEVVVAQCDTLCYERQTRTATLLRAVGVQPLNVHLKLIGADSLHRLTVLCVILPKRNPHKAILT